MLLVLDNFEQVIDAGPAIGALLSGAPGCAAIVTSRERLGHRRRAGVPGPSAVARRRGRAVHRPSATGQTRVRAGKGG